MPQKQELIESIYLYPRKIAYALVRPIDMNAVAICEDIKEFIKQHEIKKKNGQDYTENDIRFMLNDSCRAIMLSMFDHFSELTTSPKTIELLLSKETNDISEDLERLLFLENLGYTDQLTKEAITLLKEYKGTEYEIMIKLIIRKHLITNKELSYSKKQHIIDMIFGKNSRKQFLINKE